MRDHTDALPRFWSVLGPAPTESCDLGISHLRFEREGKTLLDVPALNLKTRGPTVIVGPNGAGKSLLLRLVHGLITPQSGKIRVGMEDRPARQAMLFQKPVLLRRTVAGNLRFVLKAQGVPRREMRSQIAKLLEQGQLAGKAHQPARSLSGGEQQRLALIRALATAPDLLLLDEPTAPLDPAATREIEALVQRAALSGIKVVMVTHDLGQARRLAEDVVLLHQGRVQEHSPADRFFAMPKSQAARAFLSGDLLR